MKPHFAGVRKEATGGGKEAVGGKWEEVACGAAKSVKKRKREKGRPAARLREQREKEGKEEPAARPPHPPSPSPGAGEGVTRRLKRRGVRYLNNFSNITWLSGSSASSVFKKYLPQASTSLFSPFSLCSLSPLLF